MQIVANGLNGIYLENFLSTAKSVEDITEVKAAIAYAGESYLIDFCSEKSVPLTFWCLVDESLPVSLRLLKKFKDGKSDQV